MFCGKKHLAQLLDRRPLIAAARRLRAEMGLQDLIVGLGLVREGVRSVYRLQIVVERAGDVFNYGSFVDCL